MTTVSRSSDQIAVGYRFGHGLGQRDVRALAAMINPIWPAHFVGGVNGAFDAEQVNFCRPVFLWRIARQAGGSAAFKHPLMTSETITELLRDQRQVGLHHE